MQRSALLLMALSTMLVLGGPQLAAEEVQRGRARSRGSGQVTAAPQSKSPAPGRAPRRVSSNRTGKSTGSRPTSPPKISAPRRAPGVQSSAPRTGRSNSDTAVGRARPRHSVSPPRSKVTIVTNGRVTGRNQTTSHTWARRRVVETGNAASTTTTGMSRELLKLSGSLVHDDATISDDSPSPNRASRARRAATSAGIS